MSGRTFLKLRENKMTTTLSPDFLVATMHIQGFKGAAMRRAQGALLTLALASSAPIHAAMLPGEVTEGSKHLAGAATGALVAQELLCCVGRVKSPIASAKGRRLDLLAIPEGRRATVLAWLRANGLPIPSTAEQQQELFAS